VTLVGMTVRNGQPPNNGLGGGINVAAGGSLTLVNVVVSGNRNTPGGAGGGIASQGALTLEHVILRDNASFTGGGLWSPVGASAVITNSVIADNRADASGGGIFNQGTMTLVNSRIVRNLADADNAAGGSAGGLFQNGGQLGLRRTVLARNLVGATGSAPDCFANTPAVITALGATRTQTGCGILTSLSVGDDRVGVNPVLASDVVVGAGSGGGPHVRALDPATGAEVRGFFAYDAAFTGGVRVAACDLDGDGVPDLVTGAGPGGGPHVRAFSGVDGAPLPGSIGSFLPYAPGFTGGVFVGCADVNRDGVPDVITGAGAGGGPHVRALSGLDAADLFNAFVFSGGFTGGVFVAP
jgi:FG-GAP repeat